MRQFILVLFITFFTFLCISLSATVYYSYAPSGTDVTHYNNWWTNRNGTGSHPPFQNPFSQDGDTFTVQNGHNMTASDEWYVSGTNSKVVIESGGKITTGDYDHIITLDINDGGTYEVTDTVYGQLDPGTWHANSNFIINNSGIQFEDGISYGNLTVQSGTADVTGSSGLTVRGTLTVAGGTFEGGLTTDHTNSYGSIIVSSGYFYGSTGAADVIHNVSGSISVNGGYFLATDGSGGGTYNVGGSVSIATGAWFYACYRSGSLDLPSTTWNITGSLNNSGYYYARNRSAGGYPYINLSGTGQTFKLGSFSSLEQGQHYITLTTGSSYTLTGDIFVAENYPIYLRGILDASTYSISRDSYGTGDPVIYVYGTLRTAKTAGLAGLGTSYTCNLYSLSRLYLQAGCTVEYYAAASQTVTPLTSYKALILSGAGTKNLNDDATIADNITMNATLSMGSGALLTLNGTMSGSSSITGYGDLTIAGTAAALNLVTCEVDQLILNRANGCNLAGNLEVFDLFLYSGTLALGSYGAILDGSFNRTSGSLSGSNTASLTIRGSASQVSLPALTLGTFILNRLNGVKQLGNLNIYSSLTLTLGTLDNNGNTLALYGTMSRVNGYIDVDTGILTIQPGSADITLSGISGSVINVLSVNCTGRTCYMGQDFSVTTMSIGNGTFAIGAHTLTLTGTFSCSASMTGGSSSHLIIDSMTSGPTLPALELSSFAMDISYTCSLGGNMTATSVDVERGTMNLSGRTLTVNSALTGASTNGITGNAFSILNLNGSSVTTLSLPKLNIGSLNYNRNGTANLKTGSVLQASLNLLQGTLNIPTGSSFTFGAACAIYRSSGQLTGTPLFADRVTVSYLADLTTGPEIPDSTGVLDVLQILANLEITASKDIKVITKVEVMDFSVLELGSHTLYLDDECDIESGISSLIWGRVEQDIGALGFNAPALGIWVLGGPEVTGFAVTHIEESQVLPMGVSIERTWTLEGTFDGDNTVTFIWDPAANNGIAFSSTNLAVALWKNGSGWTRLPNGVDVSGQPICMATYIVDHFSDWTISAEDQTLPVELSSFSAVLTQQNYVQLNWITQSETNMLGFKIYRNITENIDNALDLNVMIQATNTSNQHEYCYVDEEIEEIGTYYYWLQAVDLDGHIDLSNAISITLTLPQDDDDTPTPINSTLLNVYPNPFNPILYITVDHKTQSRLSVEIYDVIGRRIANLTDNVCLPGIYILTWTGKDHNNKQTSSGVYFVKCITDNKIKIKKVVLLK